MTSHNLPLRLVAVAGLALALSGCYVRKDTAGDIPIDYRKRHPITLKEGEKTVEILVGTNRGEDRSRERGYRNECRFDWNHGVPPVNRAHFYGRHLQAAFDVL